RLTQAQGEIAAEWSPFEDRLVAVTARAEHEIAHVRDGGAPTAAALDQLEHTVQPLSDEIEALLAQGRTAIEELQHWCEERNAELRERMQQVDTEADRVRQKAERVQAEIESAAGEARETMQKLGSEMEAFHSAAARHGGLAGGSH